MTGTATLGKWGNTAGVRIPRAFCQQLGLNPGDCVTLTLDNQRIIIEKPASRHTLQERMKEWDGQRLETDEFDWGEPAGKELW